jgi:ABC-type transport system involved in multi-copper enzyme maturation permease subunit
MMLRAFFALVKLSFLEAVRRQILHVMVLLSLVVIAVAGTVSFFDLGVQVKIVKDTGMVMILLAGSLSVVFLISGALFHDVEQRLVYPVLARPIPRGLYLIARYTGALAAVYAGMTLMALTLLALLWVHLHYVSELAMVAIAFTYLEVALVGALAMLLSTFFTPAMTATLTLFLYLLGSLKMGYLHHLAERNTGFAKWAITAISTVLPNMEAFRFKDALVHDLTVPANYLLLVAIYGICYAATCVALSIWNFGRREV